jgi:hypothetical protein
LTSPHVFEAISEKFKEGIIFSSDTAEEACRFLKIEVTSLLSKDLTDLEKSKSFIEKKLKESEQWLEDESFKRSLWNSGSRNSVWKDFEKDSEFQKSTMCRMDGRYGQGAQTRDVLFNLFTLAAGVGISSLGKIAIMAAYGEKAEVALTSARLSMGVDIAVGTYFSAKQTMEACHEKLEILSDSKACEPLSLENFKSLYFKKSEANQCLLTASLSIAGAGLAGLGVKSTVYSNNPKLANELQGRSATTQTKISPFMVDINRSLSSVRPGFFQRISTVNKGVLKSLNELPQVSKNSKRSTGVTAAQADQILKKIENNKVTSFCALKKYDPKSETGFCFGRALAVHIEALKLGVQKDQIKKIWALGSLENNTQVPWGYHVATVVRAKDGSWYALDPYLGKVVTAEEWAKEMAKIDNSGYMRLYVTEPNRFSPKAGSKYSPVELELKPSGNTNAETEEWNGYFMDLMKSLKKGSQ